MVRPWMLTTTAIGAFSAELHPMHDFQLRTCGAALAGRRLMRVHDIATTWAIAVKHASNA